ncbi:MAG: hypothetical protein AAF432_02180 [Planctomycetota bacterium]
MSADQKCPECGVPVQATLDGKLIWHVPESYRRRLRIGLWMIVVASGLLLLWELTIRLVDATLHDPAELIGPVYGPIRIVVECAKTLTLSVGILVFTSPTPYQRQASRWTPPSRLCLRIAFLAWIGCWILSQLISLYLTQTIGQSVILYYITVIPVILWPSFLLLYCASFTRQLGRRWLAFSAIAASVGMLIIAILRYFPGYVLYDLTYPHYEIVASIRAVLARFVPIIVLIFTAQLAFMLREKNNPHRASGQ